MFDFIPFWKAITSSVNIPDNFSEERYMTAYPDCNGKAKQHYSKVGYKQNRIMYITEDMGKRKAIPMEATPLVSVVITSYNYSKYIPSALDSVLAQTYSNFEIIVVDDGSTDTSVEIIESYAKKSTKVRLYRHDGGKNLGLSESMRLGVSKASGDYVAFCESDDMWTANHLEEKIKIINNYDEVSIISNAIKMFGDEKDIKLRGWVCQHIRRLLKQGGTPIDLRFNQEFNFIPTLSSAMIRRDVLLLLDYNTPVPAWIDFWLYRQILVKHILYFVDKELTLWRQHDSYNGMANSQKIVCCLPLFLQKSNQLIGL